MNTENMIINKITNITSTILNVCIIIVYGTEYLNGTRSLGYFITVLLIGIIGIFLSWGSYAKNKETRIAKIFNIICFTILYLFMLFTATNGLVFSCIIPMLIIITLFNDIKYTVSVAISVTVINIINVIMRVTSNDATDEVIQNAKMQAFLIVLTCAFLITVTFVSKKLNDIKIEKINMEKEKTSVILENILVESKNLTTNIKMATEEIGILNTSIINTADSMREVNNGTNESANVVQNQLYKTEEIQVNLNDVKSASSTIQRDVINAVSAIQKGQDLIISLKNVTKECESQGNLVADVLKKFKDYTDKMNSIIDLITNVATQTSLLSLNASIEAARAGEAGKGFSVVAAEISNLADQTTNATEDITALIKNISDELNVMISSINSLLDGNTKQINQVEETSQSFNSISDEINVINNQSEGLLKVVENLATSNNAIIENIQTVSAITEEVAARSNETLNSNENNKEAINKIIQSMDSINNSADNLKVIS